MNATEFVVHSSSFGEAVLTSIGPSQTTYKLQSFTPMSAPAVLFVRQLPQVKLQSVERLSSVPNSVKVKFSLSTLAEASGYPSGSAAYSGVKASYSEAVSSGQLASNWLGSSPILFDNVEFEVPTFSAATITVLHTPRPSLLSPTVPPTSPSPISTLAPSSAGSREIGSSPSSANALFGSLSVGLQAAVGIGLGCGGLLVVAAAYFLYSQFFRYRSISKRRDLLGQQTPAPKFGSSPGSV